MENQRTTNLEQLEAPTLRVGVVVNHPMSALELLTLSSNGQVFLQARVSDVPGVIQHLLFSILCVVCMYIYIYIYVCVCARARARRS